MEENELIPVDNNNAVEYTDDNIRHLSDMEHVRTRPGMYIGRLGDGAHAEDGIYVLLKEVIDNSIDEFKMQAGKKIEITVEENLRVRVRDYGRGIPVSYTHLDVYKRQAYYHSDVSRCPRATGALELYRFAFSHHTHTKEDLLQTFLQRRSTLQ